MVDPLRAALPAYFRLTRANRPYLTVEGARAHVAERLLRPQPYGPPAGLLGGRLGGLRRDVAVTASRYTDATGATWPVYTVRPEAGTGTPPRGAVVYAHGGAWVNEVAVQHWHLVAQVAAEARTTVVLPIYPLVPHGTALQVVTGFADLVLRARDEHGSEHGSEHGGVRLAGDSAGGQIALSTAQVLRDEHDVVLPRTLLISPALELSLSNPEVEAVLPTDPWLGRHGGVHLAELWRGDLPMSDPRVSPLLGEQAGLGPVTLMTGTRDILNPDARLLRDRARAAGVDLDWHEEHGLLHVYPLLPTPEGRRARAVVVDRLRAT